MSAQVAVLSDLDLDFPSPAADAMQVQNFCNWRSNPTAPSPIESSK
jgi:hypothetical protein